MRLRRFNDHVRLALDSIRLILIHTPHLEDKYKGTRVTIENLLKFQKLEPKRVLIDHAGGTHSRHDPRPRLLHRVHTLSQY